MTDERKELVDMICTMNEQQFAWFCEKVMEVLTPNEREYYEKTCKIDGGSVNDNGFLVVEQK